MRNGRRPVPLGVFTSSHHRRTPMAHPARQGGTSPEGARPVIARTRPRRESVIGSGSQRGMQVGLK